MGMYHDLAFQTPYSPPRLSCTRMFVEPAIGLLGFNPFRFKNIRKAIISVESKSRRCVFGRMWGIPSNLGEGYTF